jgi:hypothetical protein
MTRRSSQSLFESAAHVAAGDDEVGVRVAQGAHQPRQQVRRMTEVGVHNRDQAAVCHVYPRHHRRPEPLLAGAVDDANRPPSRDRVGMLPGPVGRVVVDDDDFDGAGGGGFRRVVPGVADAVDEIFDVIALVVGGHHDREADGRRWIVRGAH